MSRVQGHGGELDRVETYRGTTVQVGLSEKVRFEIAVSDSFVQPTIDALCEGARTGEVLGTERSSSCRSSGRCASAPRSRTSKR
jgi:nitrogen regulatory protein PII